MAEMTVLLMYCPFQLLQACFGRKLAWNAWTHWFKKYERQSRSEIYRPCWWNSKYRRASNASNVCVLWTRQTCLSSPLGRKKATKEGEAVVDKAKVLQLVVIILCNLDVTRFAVVPEVKAPMYNYVQTLSINWVIFWCTERLFEHSSNPRRTTSIETNRKERWRSGAGDKEAKKKDCLINVFFKIKQYAYLEFRYQY